METNWGIDAWFKSFRPFEVLEDDNDNWMCCYPYPDEFKDVWRCRVTMSNNTYTDRINGPCVYIGVHYIKDIDDTGIFKIIIDHAIKIAKQGWGISNHIPRVGFSFEFWKKRYTQEQIQNIVDEWNLILPDLLKWKLQGTNNGYTRWERYIETFDKVDDEIVEIIKKEMETWTQNMIPLPKKLNYINEISGRSFSVKVHQKNNPYWKAKIKLNITDYSSTFHLHNIQILEFWSHPSNKDQELSAYFIACVKKYEGLIQWDSDKQNWILNRM